MKNQNKLMLFVFGFVTLMVFSIYLLSLPKDTSAQENGSIFLPLAFSRGSTPEPTPEPTDKYIVIGWSDLGMHYYDQDYSVFSILPPDNNLLAQVIRVGDPPQIITQTIKVEFSFPDNIVSDSKTNFWDYEDKLFGVDLAPNVGLSGTGISGEMVIGANGTHFVVEGIPLTEFSDSAPTTPAPYQLAQLVVKDTVSDEVLAETTIVAPVSSEVNCFGCHRHSSRLDILNDHDNATGTDLAGQVGAGDPILCASCHADPAIDEPGDPERQPLSTTIHSTHAGRTTDCYSCHPGPQTQYSRGVMSQDPINQTCADCHGGLSFVGNSSRNPWTDLPRCESCHADHPENEDTLFRLSTGHGGMYCEACHNSTHAILPSREENDNLQSMDLQGHEGQISECTVCHETTPSNGGPHTP
jgi:hypothetical protein